MESARHKRLPVLPDDCRWANAKGTIRGKPAYVRLNTSLQNHAPVAGFDSEVLVVIYFNSTGDSGLPQSEADLTVVDDIEEVFKSRLEEDGTAILALIVTHDGARELYFYSSDPDAAIEHWEQTLRRRIQTHQVQFKVRPDAEWEVYADFA